MLAKLSADMLNNQVNCYTILSPARYYDVGIFFGWKNKIFIGRLNKLCILKMQQQIFPTSATKFHVSVSEIRVKTNRTKFRVQDQTKSFMQATMVASTNEIQSFKFKLQTYFPPTTLLPLTHCFEPFFMLKYRYRTPEQTIKILFCLLDKKEKLF